MRFLADQNVPGDAVAELEATGHDIVSVRTVDRLETSYANLLLIYQRLRFQCSLRGKGSLRYSIVLIAMLQ